MCVCGGGAKLLSKMLSGEKKNPQLHTVTLHLVYSIGKGARHRREERESDGEEVEGEISRKQTNELE